MATLVGARTELESYSLIVARDSDTTASASPDAVRQACGPALAG